MKLECRLLIVLLLPPAYPWPSPSLAYTFAGLSFHCSRYPYPAHSVDLPSPGLVLRLPLRGLGRPRLA